MEAVGRVLVIEVIQNEYNIYKKMTLWNAQWSYLCTPSMGVNS